MFLLVFFEKLVMIQNKKTMVRALHNADMKFIIHATFDELPKAKFEKKFAIITKKGAPGGCPTCIL